MAKSNQSFNWKGIYENSDGTFTTEGKIEKKRLLKSLHASGYTVRSTRNKDGSWTVAPVGRLSQTHRPRGTPGYRPTMKKYREPRGAQGGYRPYPRGPLRYGSGGSRQFGSPPRPALFGSSAFRGRRPGAAGPTSTHYAGKGQYVTTGPSSPGMVGYVGWKLQERKRQREGAKLAEGENNIKMKAERDAAETKQARAEAVRQYTKNQLAQEKRKFDFQQRIGSMKVRQEHREKEEARQVSIARHNAQIQQRQIIREAAIQRGEHHPTTIHNPQAVKTYYPIQNREEAAAARQQREAASKAREEREKVLINEGP